MNHWHPLFYKLGFCTNLTQPNKLLLLQPQVPHLLLHVQTPGHYHHWRSSPWQPRHHRSNHLLPCCHYLKPCNQNVIVTIVKKSIVLDSLQHGYHYLPLLGPPMECLGYISSIAILFKYSSSLIRTHTVTNTKKGLLVKITSHKSTRLL